MPPSRSDGAAPFQSLLLVAGLCATLYFARVLLVPLAFALTLSFLLLPLITRLEKRHVPRMLSVGLATALAIVVLALASWFVTREMTAVAATVQSARPEIERRIQAWHASNEGGLRSAADTVEDLVLEFAIPDVPPANAAAPVRVVDSRPTQFSATVGGLRGLLAPIGEVGVVLIFALIMLMKREELRHRLLLLAGLGNLNVVTRALAEASDRISLYLLVQLQINAAFGLLFGLGLFALRVPHAALWGLIAGVLRIVPFIGTFASMLLPLVLSIAISPGPAMPAGVFALFFILEMIAGNVVEPWMFSTRVGISELALMGSAIFWSALWGWPGLILSTPLTVCFVVMGRHLPQFRVLHSLLGTTAELSPAGHMYERLLAMDQAGAWEVAKKASTTSSLLRFYDDVLLPVLVLAEGDGHKGVLDGTQAKFLYLCVEEMISRMPVHVQLEEPNSRSERSMLIEALRRPLHKEFAVVCLSAGNRADTLTAMMLAQLLESASYQVLTLAHDAVSDEILEALASETDTMIVLCAVSPLAFGRTRSLFQRLRVHLPENRFGVALWKSEDDPDELLGRLGDPKLTVAFSTFGQALSRVKRLQEGVRKAS